MLDAIARAEQADARLERIATACHHDKDEMHKQIMALEVAKETACTREQVAIRRVRPKPIGGVKRSRAECERRQDQAVADLGVAPTQNPHVDVPAG